MKNLLFTLLFTGFAIMFASLLFTNIYLLALSEVVTITAMVLLVRRNILGLDKK